jgi:hypothetical protein
MSHEQPHPTTTPTVPGFIEERTEGVAGPPAMLLRVWCRWCCRWHVHGYTGTPVGDTTLDLGGGGHCLAPDSPYQQTGYIVRVSGTPFSAVRKTMRSATATEERAIREGRITEDVQKLRDQEPPTG